jgi:SAM-dependent methyltransferase
MNPTPNFNSLARLYRWLEYLSFGPFLWRCRIHFLPQLIRCRCALILGDGDGRFTARLLRTNPDIKITAIDASRRMIESLQQAASPHQDRLTTHVADIRNWQPTQTDQYGQYDLIVTHFFLDCLTTEEIADLTNRLTPYLAPNALWLVSEFAIPPTLYGRTIAAPLVAFLYRAFRLITNLRLKSLPDHPQALVANGWALQAQHTHLNGLLVSQLWQHQPPRPASHCLSSSSIKQIEQNEQSENGSKHDA